MTPAQAKQFMPPTTIITGQADWLRDQGQDFAKLLQSAGVACGVIQGVAILHDAAIFDLARTSPTVELIMVAIAGKLEEALAPAAVGTGSLKKQDGHDEGEVHAAKRN